MTGETPLPDGALHDLLDAWVPAQRWFAGKGTSGELTLDGHLELAGDATARVQVHVVSARTTRGEVTTYQVPLVLRESERAGQEQALIGRLPGAVVYDGAHDPAFVRSWLDLIAEQAPAGSAGGPSAQGRRQPDGVPVPVRGASRVLAGEQSNTSVIVEGAPPVIVKLFRALHDGANPDVVVQSALAAAGSTRVPAPCGWVEGSWQLPDGSTASGHLAFASEFLVGTRDAWREATQCLERGESFEREAYTLGQATAEVHRSLARTLPTETASTSRRAELVDGLRDRARWACGQVETLDGVEPAIERIHEQLDALTDFPVLQRIHGDYHLGQVLDVPDRGWVLLDFEGEPLRPISERSDPDLALRDVAGMLRSFDYAGHQAGSGQSSQQSNGQEWAAACRDVFCRGYAEVDGPDPRDQAALLVALELDKALYEVVYEARNRPNWIDVPLRAVARLTGG
jgi:predicted trehalose synthase